jgi:hypothetical protein
LPILLITVIYQYVIRTIECRRDAIRALPAARRLQNLDVMDLLFYSNWFLPGVLFRSGVTGGASADD